MTASVSPTLAWNEADGGLNLSYEVLGTSPLNSEVALEVFFADGAEPEDIQGQPIYEIAATEGSPPRTYGPEHIFGSFLSDAPNAATHIIAIAGQNSARIDDARINYARNVTPASVSIGMKDLIRDGLRQAGTSSATITSSVRSPERQAEAMFGNLSRGNNINANIQRQLAIYLAPGDAVIRVFESSAQGHTPEEIQGAERDRIIQDMLHEIDAQGCSNVSNHCGDPAILSVVDIPYQYFSGGAAGSASSRFQREVTPRLQTLLIENGVFHMEYIN